METVRRTVVALDALSRLAKIPEVYGYFERDRTQFIVQAFLDGQTAKQRLQAEGTFSEAQICQLLQSVLPVLHTLHQHRVIHRDIKPSNLIQLPGSNHWLLADLGAAKYTTDSGLKRTGTILGDAEYTAPEQLRGRATFASDIYSLGVTCIHLLTGLSPFELWDVNAQAWHWRSVVVDMSETLMDLLERCVAMAIQDRYPSIEAMTPELTQIKIHLPSLSSPTVSAIPTNHQPSTFSPSTLSPFLSHVCCLACHPIHNQFAAGLEDGQIQIWDVPTGEMLRSHIAHQQAITALAYSPDGNSIASSSWDASIRLWPELLTTPTVLSHTGSLVEALIYSPDGKFLISGSRDRSLQVWRLSDCTLVQTLAGHEVDLTAIAVSPDGQYLASADASGQVNIWLLSTQERLRTLTGHQGSVSAIAFTSIPGNNHAEKPSLLITASWDMTVQVRYPNTGGIRHTLRGHALPVSAIALHPNGIVLATGSPDQTVMLWDLVAGERQAVLECDAAVEALTFSADGEALIVVTQTGRVWVWR